MSRMPAVSPEAPRAWVVFRGDAELWWLQPLKPGFRHCLALLNDGRRWVMVDPLATFMDVAVLDVAPGWDLPGWFRGQGMAVVAAPVRRGLTRPAPWGPFTCVEAVKRVLGLHAPFVVTPWQLYCRLTLSPIRHDSRQEGPAHGQSVPDAAAAVAAAATSTASTAPGGGVAAPAAASTAAPATTTSSTTAATTPTAASAAAVRPAVVGDLPAAPAAPASASSSAASTDTHEPGAGGAGSREGRRDGHAAAHAQPRGHGADLLARGAGHQRGGADAQAPAGGMT